MRSPSLLFYFRLAVPSLRTHFPHRIAFSRHISAARLPLPNLTPFLRSNLRYPLHAASDKRRLEVAILLFGSSAGGRE